MNDTVVDDYDEFGLLLDYLVELGHQLHNAFVLGLQEIADQLFVLGRCEEHAHIELGHVVVDYIEQVDIGFGENDPDLLVAKQVVVDQVEENIKRKTVNYLNFNLQIGGQ